MVEKNIKRSATALLIAMFCLVPGAVFKGIVDQSREAFIWIMTYGLIDLGVVLVVYSVLVGMFGNNELLKE